MVVLHLQGYFIFGATVALMLGKSTSQDDSCTAQWHIWTEWSTCTDNCGGCGVYMRTRVCLTSSTACNCDGSGTKIDYCNLEVCRYPRPACCFNRTVASSNGRFVCKYKDTTSFITES